MTLPWLAPEIAQRFAGSLLHFIWQGSVIALLTAAVLKLLRHRSAEARYAAGIAGLALMLLAPVITFAFYAQTGAVALKLLQFVSDAFSTSGADSATASDVALWTQGILIVWGTGVTAFLARLVAGWHLSRQLVRTADDIAPSHIQRMFDQLKERLACTGVVRLLIHARIDSPVVVGWLRPVVLLPLSALTSLSEDQLLAVFAHELAHIRRYDFMVNMLQRCIEAVLFYHPAVWWLSKRVRFERENCCDDLAVRICGNRKLYAEALVQLERERQATPVLAVAATDSNIVARIQRILGLESGGVNWQSAIIAVVFVMVWMVAGLWQSTTLQAYELAPRVPGPAMPIAPSNTLGAIAAIVTAQPLRAEPPQIPTPPQNAIVSGKVVKAGTAGTNEAIAGAGVELRRVDSGPVKAYTATASSDGVFTFKDIPPGEYHLAATRTGFIRSEYGQRGPNGRGSTVTLTAGQDIKDAKIALTQTGAIAGVIVDRKGAPMPAVQVLALRYGYRGSTRALLAVKAATTNDLGQYRLFGLPPGQYVVTAMPLRGATMDTVTDMMSDGYSINRTVPPAAGLPILVAGDDQSIPLYYPDTTDPQLASTVSVRSGESVTGINIKLLLPATWAVRGTVTNRPAATAPTGRGGAPRISVTLSPKNTGGAPMYIDGAPMPPQAAVNPNTGAFEIRGVLPGAYDIYAVANGNGPASATGLSGLVSIEVSNSDANNVNVPLEPGFDIPFHVSISGHADDSPDIAAVRVGLVSPGTSRQYNVQPVPQQPAGTFIARGVSAGQYQVMYSVMNGLDLFDLSGTTIRMGGRDISAGFRIDRAPDNPIEVVVGVSQNSGEVHGTVVNSKMEPVANVTVVLVPDGRGTFKNVWTDAAGRFQLPKIAAGDYKLYAWEDVELYAWQSPEFMRDYVGRGTAVHIENGSNATAQVTVIPYSPKN